MEVGLMLERQICQLLEAESLVQMAPPRPEAVLAATPMPMVLSRSLMARATIYLMILIA